MMEVPKLFLVCFALSLILDYGYAQDNTETVDFSNCTCEWSQWMNNADYNPLTGDDNSYARLRQEKYDFCAVPVDIQCRNVLNPMVPFDMLPNKEVTCNSTVGLICKSRPYNDSGPNEQNTSYCIDYEIRVLCCKCPQVATIPAKEPTNSVVTNITTNATSATFADVMIVFQDEPYIPYTSPNTPTEILKQALPVYIIIVIILSVIIVFAMIVCIVRCQTARRKSAEKSSHHYVRGDLGSIHRRPVSFTDVDNYVPPENQQTSLSGRESLASSQQRMEDFEAGQLMFLGPNNGQNDQPDIVNSSRSPFGVEHVAHAHYQDEAPRRWLPDEYERSLEKQGSRPDTRNWISRTFAPGNKNTPFADDSSK